MCCCRMMSICSSIAVCSLCNVDALFEMSKVNDVYGLLNNLKIQK